MTARAVALALLVLLLPAIVPGCSAHDRMCKHATIDPSSAGAPADVVACAFDSDCVVCHDGSPCGVPMRADEARRRGEACRRPDAGECECASVACCGRRCEVSVYCPR